MMRPGSPYVDGFHDSTLKLFRAELPNRLRGWIGGKYATPLVDELPIHKTNFLKHHEGARAGGLL